MNGTADTRVSFGGFALDGLRLALPMSALKEVVECRALHQLPSPAACVVGGIELRDTTIPVVDLRVLLGRTVQAATGRNVVIIAYNGKLLGLLADGVTGIFDAQDGSFRQATVADGTPAIFLGSVQRSDSREMVSVLSAEALSCVQHVPMIEDLEPPRLKPQTTPGTEVTSTTGTEVASDHSVSMLLLQCNGTPFALEATVVHATLFNPALDVANGASERCLSTITYAGMKVPTLDLLDLCGMGRLESAVNAAILVSLPAGYVAFLISRVLDVVRIRRADVKALPAFALPRSDLFAGSLPCSAMPIDRVVGSASQYLVIDGARLQACDEVTEFAQLNVPASDLTTHQRALSTAGSSVRRRSMITYMLEIERATPLEQVVEILPYQAGTDVFVNGTMLGLMVDRDRPIPVFCLGQLTGEARCVPTSATRVLVVESDGELIGFAVRKLNSIEEAAWEPAVPTARSRDGKYGPRVGGESWKLALFEMRITERMVPIVDLAAIATALRDGALQGSELRMGDMQSCLA